MKYLKALGCLAKVLLPKSKKRKMGSKTSDCMFLGYAEHNFVYKFLVSKCGVLDCNIIIDTKNTEFFFHIFSLSNKTLHAPIEINKEITFSEELRSKRLRNFLMEMIFKLFNLIMPRLTCFDVISSFDAKL